MLEIAHYGFPEDYQEKFHQFFSPEIHQYTQQLLQEYEQIGPEALIAKHIDHPLFNYAIADAAVQGQASFVIGVIYAVLPEQKEKIHFEWSIPHPNLLLTFSNAYFVVLYNQLYRKIPDLVDRRLTKEGICLRALCTLSYTPWRSILLPVSSQMTEDFMNLPLFDREISYICEKGDIPYEQQ